MIKANNKNNSNDTNNNNDDHDDDEKEKQPNSRPAHKEYPNTELRTECL